MRDQPRSRAGFDYSDVGLLLDTDGVLNAKVASFLNTDPVPVRSGRDPANRPGAVLWARAARFL